MKVCQKQCHDIRIVLQLVQTLHGATSTIKQQFFLARFHQNAWPESSHDWSRITCPEQRDLDRLRTDGCSGPDKKRAERRAQTPRPMFVAMTNHAPSCRLQCTPAFSC